MRKVLNGSFYNRPVLTVAEELLGKYLVRQSAGKRLAFLITEVEGYDGEKDLACHARRGKTKRTAVMYGEAGHWYVYLCYGMYWMLNIVTGPVGYPAAVLIRGVSSHGGPGKLTRELKIGKSFNSKKAAPEKGLWIEDRGVRVMPEKILKTARVGISYAGPLWSKKKWRFVLKM
ncbi:MAG: DNA-3-methyladenine glycosylase [bacterium]|nr:DNA-3-methyladenine glycosylase [bacterium]